MRRIAGFALEGIGVFLIVLAPLLAFWVTHALEVTPINQYAENIAPGTGTVFDPATLQERQNVSMVAHRIVRGDVKASTHKTGVWDEFLTLTDSNGTLISATTDRVAWDRKTAVAVNCCNENVNGEPTKHVGLSYKYPFHSGKKTYLFFDTMAKKAYPAVYSGSEKLQGLTTYKYVQDIAPVQIGQTDLPGSLLGQPSVPSIPSPEFYKNIRTVWVEPRTGVIIKGSEQQLITFRDSSGADKVTALDTTLTFDEATQKSQAKLAKDSITKIKLLGVYLPIGCGILGIAALIGGVLLMRGGGRREPTPTPTQTPSPAPARS